jgi:prepilin-type N-terminal cleavage/methylation domain-containing protein
MRRHRGFSLIELIAVLTLIAIVAGAAAVSLSGNLAGAKNPRRGA